MTQETKDHIDSLSVCELLRKVRFAPAGDPLMQGEVGAYWLARLAEKRAENNAAYVQASKQLGWE
jgi:hypothetical protein